MPLTSLQRLTIEALIRDRVPGLAIVEMTNIDFTIPRKGGVNGDNPPSVKSYLRREPCSHNISMETWELLRETIITRPCRSYKYVFQMKHWWGITRISMDDVLEASEIPY